MSDIGKIANAIIQSLGGVGVGHASVLGCGASGGAQNPVSCTDGGAFETFQCGPPLSFVCGGRSGAFSCTSKLTDDFECIVSFECKWPNGFACIGSFDDPPGGPKDDCEGFYSCTAVSCGSGGNDFNN